MVILPFLSDNCEINISQDLSVPQPLMLNANQSAFLSPVWNDTSGLIRLRVGEILHMYCPNGVRNLDGKLIVATCLGGKSYQIGSEKYKLKDIRCVKHPWITLQPIKHSRSYCQGNEIADIGFRLLDNNNQFVKTMSICHAIRNLTTFYTIYDLKPYSVGFQKGVGRLGFIQAREFNYSTSYDKLYSRDNQRQKLEEMLEDSENSYDLDDYYDNDRLFLSRGHLGAKADFFWGNQQRSTFFYLNAAPQWQSINGGNWQRVEDGIRRYVASKKFNATIISGTHKVLRFPSLSDGELFLGGTGLLPVPQYFYKLVYDEANSRGIVFVSINNPHILEEDVKDYLFCENVIERVNWINLKSSPIMGFIFACDVNQFLEKMEENLLPKLVVKDLLL